MLISTACFSTKGVIIRFFITKKTIHVEIVKNISTVKIIKDSRGVKKPELFFNYLKFFALIEHRRVDIKIIIDLLENFSAIVISKNHCSSKKINKEKGLFLNFIRVSFTKTCFVIKVASIGFILIENTNTNFEIKHGTSK